MTSNALKSWRKFAWGGGGGGNILDKVDPRATLNPRPEWIVAIQTGKRGAKALRLFYPGVFEEEKSRVDYEVGSGQLISGLVTRGKKS